MSVCYQGILNTFKYSIHTSNMSESETCPKCKTGKLRPEEGRTAGAIDLVCDNASCRHYKVSGSVTKKDDGNDSPSDAV
jgi:hypothetical protein